MKTTESARATKAAAADTKAHAPSNSGLDTSGQFRIGDKITLSVRDGDLCLLRAGSADEVIVSEASLAGLLIDEYFTTHK